MMKKISLSISLCLVLVAALATAQTTTPQSILQKGMQEYQQAKYQAALQDFRDIILNPQFSAVHGDAYYWVSLSYIALNKLPDAEKNLEYFLLNFKDNSYVPEGYYQKGRLLYLQKEYQKSIQVLYTFVTSYKDNPYVGNAYYWIGESLYRLGHFAEAKKVFEAVISKYPTSFKVEAARYRLSLIDLKQRELELMKLLRWSNENALKAEEQFNQRQTVYEQAIIAYQRKIARLEAGAPQPAAQTAPGSGQISSLKSQIAKLESQVQSMTSQGSGAAASASTTTTQSLLALKAEALDLKESYLNWLSSHPGAGQ